MLFQKKIEKSCTYCVHGPKLEEDQILCVKKGVVPCKKCRKFTLYESAVSFFCFNIFLLFKQFLNTICHTIFFI